MFGEVHETWPMQLSDNLTGNAGERVCSRELNVHPGSPSAAIAISAADLERRWVQEATTPPSYSFAPEKLYGEEVIWTTATAMCY